MKPLKRVILISLALTLAGGKALAQSRCEELQNRLVVLESQLQSSKMPKCEAEQKEFCCDPAQPLTCKTFLELQTAHNEMMGKLVVYEGLIAIGMALEADHSAIQELKRSDLQRARNHVEDFLTGYRKAALIESSLDADFWLDKDGKAYSGRYVEDLDKHIKAQCARPEKLIQRFCDQLDSASEEKGVEFSEVLDSLAAFGLADAYGRISPADRHQDYANYRKALELRIGGEKVDYRKDHEQIKKIARLRELLEQAEGPQEGQAGQERAAEILRLAKQLDGLEANYGEMIRPRDQFKDFFDSDLKKSLASFNQGARALLKKDKMEQNMDKLSAMLEKSKQGAMTSIEHTIKEKTDCSGSGASLLACFERVCSPDVRGRCRQGEEPRLAQSLSVVNDQLRALESMDQLNQRIEEAKSCLGAAVESQETRECSAMLKSKLGLAAQDDVDHLRARIHEIESAMESMNRASTISDIKLSKAMGLRAYRHSGCLDRDDVHKISDFNLVCEREAFDTFSQQAIQLSNEAGNILEFSRNPFLNDELEFPAKEFKAYKTEFLRRCEEKRADPELCNLYITDDALSGREAEKFRSDMRRMKAQMTANRRLPAKIRRDESEDLEPGKAFLAGLGTSLVTRGVPYFLAYDQTRSQHKSMMNYYENRLSYMQSQYNMQNNAVIPYYYHPYTNYGYSLYDYGSAAQFGGSSSTFYFKNSADYTQYSFAPSMAMDQFGSSNFTTPASGGSGFNFSP